MRTSKRTPFRITPSLRRKIDDLALWLSEGRPGAVAEARRAVVGLLAEAARKPLLTLLGEPASSAGVQSAPGRTQVIVAP